MSIKYLGLGIPILMYDGMTKLSDKIEKFDVLMGINSEQVKVLNIEESEDTMYKLIQRYGTYFTIGGSHRLLTTSFDDMYLFDVENYEYNSNISLIKSNIDFPYQNLYLDPYFFGVWLCQKESNREIKFANYPEYISDHLIAIASENDIDMVLSPEYIKIVDEDILEYFEDSGLFDEKHIPDIYKYNKSVFRLRLLAGILDSKGEVNEKKKCFVVAETERMIKDINFICQSLGLCTNVFKGGIWKIVIY